MAPTAAPQGLAAWVVAAIEQFCAGPANSLQDTANERAWDAPLVGFSSGADPLYEQYKEYVGPFHWTPLEIFSQAFPQARADPTELTVICWILPQTGATRADNRRQTLYPAERWARSRIYGEEFNDKLRQHVVNVLSEAGYAAVAPTLSPHWASKPSERYVFASTWSERHAAYASGLGTFGLCDGLITPVGKAMRVGSVVARIPIPPSPRPYADHHAYCLFFARGKLPGKLPGELPGTCGKCITRCPARAISPTGHDKVKCRQYLNSVTAEYVKSHYGFDGYGCGLCQTDVPCEFRIPAAVDVTKGAA